MLSFMDLPGNIQRRLVEFWEDGILACAIEEDGIVKIRVAEYWSEPKTPEDAMSRVMNNLCREVLNKQ